MPNKNEEAKSENEKKRVKLANKKAKLENKKLKQKETSSKNKKAEIENKKVKSENKEVKAEKKIKPKKNKEVKPEELNAKTSKYIKYVSIAILVLILITIIGVLNINRNKNINKDDGVTKIVTSFYPMYIIAKNLVDGASNVELTNMADVNVGCLHNYTLKTEDIKKVENADIFISNGLGMESFINKLIETNNDMDVIDSSANVKNTISDDDEVNPHIWTSIDNYIEQVKTVAEKLKEYDHTNAKVYEDNKKEYISKLVKLKNKFNVELKKLQGKRAICLNEAFEYMGKDLGLQLTTLKTDHEESTLSAETLKNVTDVAKTQEIKIILVDKNDNKSNAQTIANEIDAQILELNSGLTGSLDKDAYINAMEENIEKLKSVEN